MNYPLRPAQFPKRFSKPSGRNPRPQPVDSTSENLRTSCSPPAPARTTARPLAHPPLKKFRRPIFVACGSPTWPSPSPAPKASHWPGNASSRSTGSRSPAPPSPSPAAKPVGTNSPTASTPNSTASACAMANAALRSTPTGDADRSSAGYAPRSPSATSTTTAGAGAKSNCPIRPMNSQPAQHPLRKPRRPPKS